MARLKKHLATNELNQYFMNSQGQVLQKTKNIGKNFNRQVAIRNVLFVLAVCLVYLLGKYYQSVHNATVYSTSKIRFTKNK